LSNLPERGSLQYLAGRRFDGSEPGLEKGRCGVNRGWNMVLVYCTAGCRVASTRPAAPRLPVGAWIPPIVLRRKFEPPVSKYQGSLNSDGLTTDHKRGLTWFIMQSKTLDSARSQAAGNWDLQSRTADCVRTNLLRAFSHCM
jgi:hypothetical protein